MITNQNFLWSINVCAQSSILLWKRHRRKKKRRGPTQGEVIL